MNNNCVAFRLSKKFLILLAFNPTPAPQVLPLKRGEDWTNLGANLSPLQGDEKNGSFSGGVGKPNQQITKNQPQCVKLINQSTNQLINQNFHTL